ncbi:MAG: metalloregulator ArsR/SmtB family transcription factor [Candidatus Nanopelagicales bacterium]|nr:metalloregulator ArsR/SmtB family transcription factor [Candidatus Nanopelagicales bacterium]
MSPSEVDRLFHALADATRRDIVQRVAGTGLSITELARRYPMTMTAVQKHVGVLVDAGLVTKRRHGREQRVIGNLAAVQRAQQLLAHFEQLWRVRVAAMADILDETDEGARA